MTPGRDLGQSVTLTSVIDWKLPLMVLCCFPATENMAQAAQFCAHLASCCKELPNSRAYSWKDPGVKWSGQILQCALVGVAKDHYKIKPAKLSLHDIHFTSVIKVINYFYQQN